MRLLRTGKSVRTLTLNGDSCGTSALWSEKKNYPLIMIYTCLGLN